MTITQSHVDAAAAAMRTAASQSYKAYQAAKLAHERLVADYTEQQRATLPLRSIIVVGDTYRHRSTLAALGLRWDTTARAWMGTVRGQIDLPAGCHETTYGAAAVASMDYASSDC